MDPSWAGLPEQGLSDLEGAVYIATQAHFKQKPGLGKTELNGSRLTGGHTGEAPRLSTSREALQLF